MEYLGISPYKFQDFLLILVRVTSFSIAAPFFGFRNVPMPVKALLGFFLSLIISSVIPCQNYVISCTLELFVLALQQVLTGVILGFVAGFVFDAIRMAGEFIDLQMGFGMANVFDPALQIRQTLFGEFSYLVALLLFMVMNGHHFLLRQLIATFYQVPLYQLGFSSHLKISFMANFAALFVSGLKIALPIVVVLTMIDIITGMISRLIPQLNIFVVSFPFKIAVGFVALMVLLPQILVVYRDMIAEMLLNLRGLF